MDRTKLKQAIEFAKQNPDSEYANELRKRIESGQIIIETEKPNYLERVAGQYSDIGERTTEALKKSGQEYLEKAKYEFALCRQLQATSFPQVLIQVAEHKFYLLAKGYTDYEALKSRIDSVLAEAV